MTMSSGSLLITLTENKWCQDRHVTCGLNTLKQRPLVMDEHWVIIMGCPQGVAI